MTRLIFILLTAALCSFAMAQTFEWVNTVPLDIQTNPAYLHSPAALDNSDNPVTARLVHFRELYTAYYGDIEIMKSNASGSVLWADTIFGKADVSEIIVDGENSVICTGTFMDTLEIDNNHLIYTGQGTGSFVIKLDSSGNLAWLKDGSEFITGFGEITALAKDGLNNILLGTSNYPVEARILTLDSGGSQVSAIVETNIATISDINRDISGNLWVTGFTFSGSVSFNGLDTTAPFSYNEYVVKFDPSGSAQRVNFIEDVTVQDFEIETDNAGNAYLGGNLLDSTSFGSLHANGPQWVYDFFVTKMNSEGNFIWLNEIPPGNSLGDAYIGTDNFLSCREDGQTYLTGTFRGKINFGNGVILTPLDYSDAFVLSYGSDGAIKWGKAMGSTSYDQGCGITADENGNCYSTGLVSEHFVFDTISGTGGLYNLYLAELKTENAVSVENGFNPAGSLYNFSLMQNYPNPFNPSTKLSFVIGNSSFVTLKVYDALGREVSTLVNEYKPAGRYEINWDAADFPSGVYFSRLQAGSEVQVRKMMMVK